MRRGQQQSDHPGQLIQNTNFGGVLAGWDFYLLYISFHTHVLSVVYCSNLTKLEYYLTCIDNVCFAKLDFTLQPLQVNFIFVMHNSTNDPFQQMPVAVVSPWSCYRIVGY